LQGDFCHSCGQQAHVHRTLRAFGHDLLHGALRTPRASLSLENTTQLAPATSTNEIKNTLRVRNIEFNMMGLLSFYFRLRRLILPPSRSDWRLPVR
jgi:hypothetical protein